jgi:outer membrane immunogenic protein
MRNSKLIVSAVVAISAILGISAAAAADLPARTYTKAPVAPAAPVWSWTGLYIGGNVGGAWARSDVTDVNAFAAGATPGTVTGIRKSGFLGGGDVGYNWQMGQFVFGLEGDGGWMDIGRQTLLTGTGSNTMVGLNGAAYGDVTGRIGFAWDRALFYAKGGYAILGTQNVFSTTAGFTRAGTNNNNSGYTIGGGVEYKFTPNWSAKVEYMYYDFGHDLNFSLTPPAFPFIQTLRIDTVKFGLNYAFGGGPVVAKY